jgi:hypothetical protein
MYPHALKYPDRRGIYPFISKWMPAISNELLMFIMNQYPTHIQQTGNDGNFPLHIVLHGIPRPENIYMKLIEIYPDAAKYCNREGNFPLHLACLRMYESTNTMRTVYF